MRKWTPVFGEDHAQMILGRARLAEKLKRTDPWTSSNRLSVAATGLRAQMGRMRVISENIANADSVSQTAGGDPYRRRIVTFNSVLDRELGAHVSSLDRSRPTVPIFCSGTSRAIRRPMPPATSNIRT